MLLKTLNATHKGTYYLNCFNGFSTVLERDISVQDFIYATCKFKSISKLVDEQYREKMNQMKITRKGNPTYAEKINMHVLGVTSALVYGVVFDPMRTDHCKDCVQTFVQNIEDEVKQWYVTFPQQQMTELMDTTKREHEAAEKCHICLKVFAHDEQQGDNYSEYRKVRDYTS